MNERAVSVCQKMKSNESLPSDSGLFKHSVGTFFKNQELNDAMAFI